MMRFADRVGRLGAEGFDAVLTQVARLRAAGRRVLPLRAGEPDFETPAHITEAAMRSLRSGETHYVPTGGTPALREAIAEHVAATRGIPVNARQVVVVPGAKPMLYLALLALCADGDEVIYPEPSYPIYESLIRFVGATPVPVSLAAGRGFHLDPSALLDRITGRTRALILNSPANPTGEVMAADELRAVAAAAAAHDLVVISDEIYSRIVYDAPFASVASLPGMADRTVIVDGFSKTYAMTGWRLGYGVMAEGLARQVERLVLNTLSCTTAFVQAAGVEALRGPQDAVDAMVSTFRRRRDTLVAALNRVPGMTCWAPQGAFYAFPSIEALGVPSTALAEALLQDADVAVYPGRAFGVGGEGYLRLSFACSEAILEDGVARLRRLVEEHRLPRAAR